MADDDAFVTGILPGTCKYEPVLLVFTADAWGDDGSLLRESLCDRIVFTGRIDEYYDFRLGELEYRSLRFEHETLDTPNYQGVAVMNFTEREIPYTRIIEHKHFEPGGDQPRTIITREYPAPYEHGAEPYYPVNDQRNTKLYESYKALADRDRKVIFGGRLGEYRYYDMDKVIESALKLTL